MSTTDPDLNGLLHEVDELLDRYVAFPTDAHRHAIAAWVSHCWALDAFDSTPRLCLLSPEKGSGKTRTLEVVELLVPSPILTVNVSAAALFRRVADGGVTLLLDEADAYLGPRVAQDHEDLRALVNAGHRRGAKALRAVPVGQSIRVEEFPCFAPVALAGIGDLPDTITDRSVIVSMRRRAPNEHVEPFRHRRADREAEPIAGRLEAWSARGVARLEDAEPIMPVGIVDRPADVWEPLVAIGDLAGEPWTDRIRYAAVGLNADRAQRDPSIGVRLLTDVRAAFGDRDRMTSEALVAALVGMDEAPWGDLRGRAIDARGIAQRLRKYDIRPRKIRTGDYTAQGYRREDLHDAWLRYLPAPSSGTAEQAEQQEPEARRSPPEADPALGAVPGVPLGEPERNGTRPVGIGVVLPVPDVPQFRREGHEGGPSLFDLADFDYLDHEEEPA